MNKSDCDGTLFILPGRSCILNLRIVLLIKPQSVIRLFCANKHSFNLTQQGIPYIYKGCSWGKCYLFRLLLNNVKVK